MDNHEPPLVCDEDALFVLGTRDAWPVDELPRGYDADLMRSMDDRGWVEARTITMWNRAKYPGDTSTPPTATARPWESPSGNPSAIGGWESVLAMKPPRDDPWHRPAEIRLTDKGRAALRRLRIEGADAGEGTDKAGLSPIVHAVALLCEEGLDGKPLHTVGRVAKTLRIDPGTLYRWAERNDTLKKALSSRKAKRART